MTTVQKGHPDAPSTGESARKALLFDLSGIDLNARLFDRSAIERLNPHRGEMSLLDWVVWASPDFTHGVGLKHIRNDAFWVAGHFPGRPMFPGVLMVETAAQLACFLYTSRTKTHSIAAFLRIDNAAFRHVVRPGDDLFLLCRDVKFQRRRFVCDVQGVVDERIAFDARITGMSID